MEIKLRTLGIIGILTVVLIFAAAIALRGVPQGQIVTNSLVGTGSSNQNLFKGVVIGGNLAPQRIEGKAATDEGCGSVGGGLVECTTKILTSKGTVRFTYRHNMNLQPCLAMSGPENVVLNLLDSNGNAEVTRTQPVSSMH